RLQKGRLRQILDDKRPGLVAGPAGGETAQKILPALGVVLDRGLARAVQRQRRELHAERVPRMALMWTEEGMRQDLVFAVKREELRQTPQDRTCPCGRDWQERFSKQIEHLPPRHRSASA